MVVRLQYRESQGYSQFAHTASGTRRQHQSARRNELYHSMHGLQGIEDVLNPVKVLMCDLSSQCLGRAHVDLLGPSLPLVPILQRSDVGGRTLV